MVVGLKIILKLKIPQEFSCSSEIILASDEILKEIVQVLYFVII
ncbi:11872_t:CDS:2 [Entrophospora sp. SA101]|nr:11872_t:CDS:2 [Entrophospora sp. SA101]